MKPFINLFTYTIHTETDTKVRHILEEYAKINPIHAEVLIQRANMQEKKRAVIESRSDFLVLIEAIDLILMEVETQLTKMGK